MPDDGELFAIPEFRWPWGREESLDSIDLETTRVIRRLRAIAEQNHEIVHRLRRLQMTQAQEDAAVREILTDVGKLQAAGQAILAWIAEQPPEVDVSGLTDAVTQLDEATGGVVNIATPLQPPAEPVTPPVDETPAAPVDASGAPADVTGATTDTAPGA